MKELLRTTDEYQLTYLETMLRGEGLSVVVLDRNISVLEGSIGIFPRRLMVAEEDYEEAVELLEALQEHEAEFPPEDE